MANFPIDIPINIPGIENLSKAAVSLVKLGAAIKEFQDLKDISVKIQLDSSTWKAEVAKLREQIGAIPLKATLDAKELKLPKEHTVQVKLDLRDAETALRRMFINPGGYGAQKVMSPQQGGTAPSAASANQVVEKATQQNSTKTQPFKVSVTLDMESKKKIDAILQNNIKNLKLELSNLSVSGTALSSIQRSVEQTVQKSNAKVDVQAKTTGSSKGGGGDLREYQPQQPQGYAHSGKMGFTPTENMVGKGAGAVSGGYDYMRNSIFQAQLAYWSASFLVQNPISSKMMQMGQQAYGFGKESIQQTDEVQRMKLQLFGATRSKKVTDDLVNLSREIELQSIGTFKDIFGIVSSLAIQPTLKPVMQSGSKQDVKKLVQTTQMLGLMNPFGMEGAQFIMQEMMSGELYSVGRRLNVTPDTMLAVAGSSRAKYNAASALERADILGSYSRKVMGEDTLDKFNSTFKNTMENTQGYVEVLQTHIGYGGKERTKARKGEPSQEIADSDLYGTLTKNWIGVNKVLQSMQTSLINTPGGATTQNKIIGETFGSVGKALVNSVASTVKRSWEGGFYTDANDKNPIYQKGLSSVFRAGLVGMENWRAETAQKAQNAKDATADDGKGGARAGEIVWNEEITKKLTQLSAGFVAARANPEDVWNKVSNAVQMPDDVRALGKAVVDAIQEGLKTVLNQAGHWGVEFLKAFSTAFISGAGSILSGVFTGIQKGIPGVAGGPITGTLLSYALPAYAALKVGGKFGSSPQNDLSAVGGGGGGHEGPWRQYNGGKQPSIGMQDGGMMGPFVSGSPSGLVGGDYSASPYVPYSPSVKYTRAGQRLNSIKDNHRVFIQEFGGAPYSPLMGGGMMTPSFWGGTGISSKDVVSKGLGMGLVGGSMIANYTGGDTIGTVIGATTASLMGGGAMNLLAKRSGTFGVADRIGKESAVGLDTTKNFMFSAMPMGAMVAAISGASTYGKLKNDPNATTGAWAGGIGHALMQGMLATSVFNFGSAKEEAGSWKTLAGRHGELRGNVLGHVEELQKGAFAGTGTKEDFYKQLGNKYHFEGMAKQAGWDDLEKSKQYETYQHLNKQKRAAARSEYLTERFGVGSTGRFGRGMQSLAIGADAATGGIFSSAFSGATSGTGSVITGLGSVFTKMGSAVNKFGGHVTVFGSLATRIGGALGRAGSSVSGAAGFVGKLGMWGALAAGGYELGSMGVDWYKSRQLGKKRKSQEGDFNDINSLSFGKDTFPAMRSTRDAFDAAIKGTDMFEMYMSDVDNNEVLKSFTDAQKGLIGKAKEGNLVNPAERLLGAESFFPKLDKSFKKEDAKSKTVSETYLNEFDKRVRGTGGGGINKALGNGKLLDQLLIDTIAASDMPLGTNEKMGNEYFQAIPMVKDLIQKNNRYETARKDPSSTTGELKNAISDYKEIAGKLTKGDFSEHINKLFDSTTPTGGALTQIAKIDLEGVDKAEASQKESAVRQYTNAQKFAAAHKLTFTEEAVSAATSGEIQDAMAGRKTYAQAMFNVQTQLDTMPKNAEFVNSKFEEATKNTAKNPVNQQTIKRAVSKLGEVSPADAKTVEENFAQLMSSATSAADKINFGQIIGDIIEKQVEAIQDSIDKITAEKTSLQYEKEAEKKPTKGNEVEEKDYRDKQTALDKKINAKEVEINGQKSLKDTFDRAGSLASSAKSAATQQKEFTEIDPRLRERAVITKNQGFAAMMNSNSQALPMATTFGPAAVSALLAQTVGGKDTLKTYVSDVMSNPNASAEQVAHAAEMQQKVREADMAMRTAPYMAAQKENAMGDQEYSARFGQRDDYFSHRMQFASSMSKYDPSLSARTAREQGSEDIKRFDMLKAEAQANPEKADWRGMARASREASLAFAHGERPDLARQYEAISANIEKTMIGKTENNAEDYAKNLTDAGTSLKEAAEMLKEAAGGKGGSDKTGTGVVGTAAGTATTDANGRRVVTTVQPQNDSLVNPSLVAAPRTSPESDAVTRVVPKPPVTPIVPVTISKAVLPESGKVAATPEINDEPLEGGVNNFTLGMVPKAVGAMALGKVQSTLVKKLTDKAFPKPQRTGTDSFQIDRNSILNTDRSYDAEMKAQYGVEKDIYADVNNPNFKNYEGVQAKPRTLPKEATGFKEWIKSKLPDFLDGGNSLVTRSGSYAAGGRAAEMEFARDLKGVRVPEPKWVGEAPAAPAEPSIMGKIFRAVGLDPTTSNFADKGDMSYHRQQLSENGVAVNENEVLGFTKENDFSNVRARNPKPSTSAIAKELSFMDSIKSGMSKATGKIFGGGKKSVEGNPLVETGTPVTAEIEGAVKNTLSGEFAPEAKAAMSPQETIFDRSLMTGNEYPMGETVSKLDGRYSSVDYSPTNRIRNKFTKPTASELQSRLMGNDVTTYTPENMALPDEYGNLPNSKASTSESSPQSEVSTPETSPKSEASKDLMSEETFNELNGSKVEPKKGLSDTTLKDVGKKIGSTAENIANTSPSDIYKAGKRKVSSIAKGLSKIKGGTVAKVLKGAGVVGGAIGAADSFHTVLNVDKKEDVAPTALEEGGRWAGGVAAASAALPLAVSAAASAAAAFPPAAPLTAPIVSGAIELGAFAGGMRVGKKLLNKASRPVKAAGRLFTETGDWWNNNVIPESAKTTMGTALNSGAEWWNSTAIGKWMSTPKEPSEAPSGTPSEAPSGTPSGTPVGNSAEDIARGKARAARIAKQESFNWDTADDKAIQEHLGSFDYKTEGTTVGGNPMATYSNSLPGNESTEYKDNEKAGHAAAQEARAAKAKRDKADKVNDMFKKVTPSGKASANYSAGAFFDFGNVQASHNSVYGSSEVTDSGTKWEQSTGGIGSLADAASLEPGLNVGRDREGRNSTFSGMSGMRSYATGAVTANKDYLGGKSFGNDSVAINRAMPPSLIKAMSVPENAAAFTAAPKTPPSIPKSLSPSSGGMAPLANADLRGYTTGVALSPEMSASIAGSSVFSNTGVGGTGAFNIDSMPLPNVSSYAPPSVTGMGESPASRGGGDTSGGSANGSGEIVAAIADLKSTLSSDLQAMAKKEAVNSVSV